MNNNIYILGISALYHDSAAALIKNGRSVAAAQEERFTRIKHDKSFPINAIRYCLQSENIKQSDLQAIVYYDNPLLTLDRFLNNVLALGEDSTRLIEKSFESIFYKKMWIHELVKKELGGLGKHQKLLITKHHISHAASAFYPSPYEKAVILTIDGVGEWTTTAIGVGDGEKIKLYEEIRYPHSIGLMYSAFAYFCGFKVNTGEYKFMGLAPYGKPIYYDAIKQKIIDVKPDGSFRLNLEFFDYQNGGTMINEEKFFEFFGGGRRKAESRITQREMDIAASVQKLTEEIIVLLARHAKEKYGKNIPNLVLSGGVALNCVANGKLVKTGIFDNIWIQPAADDAGGALGCALYAYYSKYNGKRIIQKDDSQRGSLLGPEYSSDDIEKYLKNNKYSYHKYNDKDKWAQVIANLLSEEKIIGLMKGRMEFGPRALGNRSIIADCRSPYMQARINLKIKYRESFRPFAPIVLVERENDYFDLPCDSPYMLMVGNVQKKRCVDFDLEKLLLESEGDMLKIVSQKRSDIPAVTHVDYSARVQTVDNKRNPDLYLIMKKYESLTETGVLVNTSFNVRGEPIVCSPKDAYECFMHTDMDVLVLENFILYKCEQSAIDKNIDWKKEYELD